MPPIRTEKPAERKKRCHCTPDCNILCSSRTRNRHYLVADPRYIEPSESESELANAESESSGSDSETEPESEPENPPPKPILVGSPPQDPDLCDADNSSESGTASQHQSDSMDVDDLEDESSVAGDDFNTLTPE